MRWRLPWAKTETRSSAGGYTDALVAQLVAQAEGSTAAKATTTAAMEAAAGALSRAFMGAAVEGPAWAAEAVHGPFLALVGRDLIRRGESLHAIRMDGGRTVLVPCSDWDWQSGGPDPSTWTVRATAYGPSESVTWRLPAAAVIYVCWGAEATRPYRGVGPSGFASLSARQMAESERSLANEAGGPIAQIIALPQDGGDDDDEDDPLAGLKAQIRKSDGRAAFVETTAAGWGDGKGAAPLKDWIANRLGPNMPAAFVELARDAFLRTLAACGTPAPLFLDSDGTSQREALRRWHLGTVIPLAQLLEEELSAKLDAPIRLRFDAYPLDLAGRAQAFQKLVAGGMDPTKALATAGLLADDAAG